MSNDIDRPTKYNPVPAERKQEIVEAAKLRIIEGNDTLEAIAADYGITSRTLRYWLASLGEDYQQLRQAWIDSMLADAAQAIDSANEQFPLARAREQWKYATWYAERRDSRYQPKQVESSERVSVSFTIHPPTNRDEVTHITVDSVVNRDSIPLSVSSPREREEDSPT